MSQTPSLRTKWKKVSLPNKLTVLCTFVIAGATVWYAVVAHKQWATMSAQLRQMEGGSRQTDALIRETHDLAVAAKGQADASRAIADAAKGQSDSASAQATSMRALAERAIAQVDAANRLTSATKGVADAALDTARTGREHFVVSQRPWIKVSHKIVTPLTFNASGPLSATGETTFNVLNAEKKPIAFMIAERRLENVGQSVAVSVHAWEDVVPIGPQGSIENAKDIQRKWCDANRYPDTTSISGLTLFPHDPVTIRTSMGPTMESIADVTRRESPEFRGRAAFVLVGCVCYKAPFEGPEVPTHQTRFMYFLGEPQSIGFQPYVKPIGVASHLTIVTTMPMGFTAD